MTVADPGFPGECQPQASPNLLFCKVFTENCMKKRMHSSRMHTTRSFTVSRSIGVEGCCGGLPNLPLMQTPCMQIPQEADPPWMQTSLEADPLDVDPWRQTPLNCVETTCGDQTSQLLHQMGISGNYPLLLTKSGGHHMYGRQAGGTDLTLMLSCCIVA